MAASQDESYRRVVIIGTGAMGCSVASLVRGRAAVEEVVGVDSVPAHLEMARRLGFIQRGIEDPVRAVIGAEVVVLAVPIDEVFITLKQIGPDLRPDAVVTCTAGTTLRIWDQVVREVPALASFVPSFPLVFSAAQGPAAAGSGLLDGAECLVGSSDRFTPGAGERIASFWRTLGLEPQVVGMEAFERAVAGRHFWPLLMSSLLRGQAERHGWLEGKAVLSRWLTSVTRAVDPGKSYQLYAGQLCELLDELDAELIRVRKKLGGVPRPEAPGEDEDA